MRIYRYISMFLFLGLLASCQTTQDRVESRLATAFEETMFGQHGPTSDRPQEPIGMVGRLSKWRSPVKVAIVQGATPENIEATRERLESLAALSNLEIELLDKDAGEGALKVHFSDKRDFVINGNQQAACYAHTEADDAGWIFLAEVHISLVEEGEWRIDCLTHELLHALGWRGHTHSIRSAISYMHGEHELTEWDEYLMRTLYDQRLQAGTPKADALPKVRAILRELLMEG